MADPMRQEVSGTGGMPCPSTATMAASAPSMPTSRIRVGSTL